IRRQPDYYTKKGKSSESEAEYFCSNRLILLGVRYPFITFRPPAFRGQAGLSASVPPHGNPQHRMRRLPPEDDDRKKRWKFGQNFLIDDTVIRKIAEDVGCRPKDWVIEIGPGAGAITRRLAPDCAKLTAIEIDPKWVDHLKNRSEWGNIEVIHADATRVDVEEILKREASKPLVVGNLPYNRAAPILFRFLPHIQRFQAMNIMVQLEVAKRICARPHSRDFGFLTVFIQNYATAEILQKVHQDAFRPRPQVFSATVRLTPLPAPHTTDPMFLRFAHVA